MGPWRSGQSGARIVTHKPFKAVILEDWVPPFITGIIAALAIPVFTVYINDIQERDKLRRNVIQDFSIAISEYVSLRDGYISIANIDLASITPEQKDEYRRRLARIADRMTDTFQKGLGTLTLGELVFDERVVSESRAFRTWLAERRTETAQNALPASEFLAWRARIVDLMRRQL